MIDPTNGARMSEISRYRADQGDEGEWQPGSRRRVLRNLRGVTSKRAMDQAEYEALERAQERYLHIITADTRITTQLICRMHKNWLGTIYPWAGTYRSVEL